MMFLLQVITFYFENISIFKMPDIITHKITILTAKDKILRYNLLLLFLSILPTGSDYVHPRGLPTSPHSQSWVVLLGPRRIE